MGALSSNRIRAHTHRQICRRNIFYTLVRKSLRGAVVREGEFKRMFQRTGRINRDDDGVILSNFRKVLGQEWGGKRDQRIYYVRTVMMSIIAFG